MYCSPLSPSQQKDGPREERPVTQHIYPYMLYSSPGAFRSSPSNNDHVCSLFSKLASHCETHPTRTSGEKLPSFNVLISRPSCEMGLYKARTHPATHFELVS